jgi:methylphosphotriester-DNA--protein-cysteine methyltransferase
MARSGTHAVSNIGLIHRRLRSAVTPARPERRQARARDDSMMRCILAPRPQALLSIIDIRYRFSLARRRIASAQRADGGRPPLARHRPINLISVTAMPEGPFDPDAPRWQAVLNRAAAPACGPFLYAVTTQGVFCKPGCPSRAPLRRNTRFFDDIAGAEAAGFRACKRCDPKGDRARLHADAVAAACAMIEEAETMPSLVALAARAGYARHHFLRLFRDVTGVTPRSYAEGVRARRLQRALADGDRVAEAVAGAGFGSESRGRCARSPPSSPNRPPR